VQLDEGGEGDLGEYGDEWRTPKKKPGVSEESRVAKRGKGAGPGNRLTRDARDKRHAKKRGNCSARQMDAKQTKRKKEKNLRRDDYKRRGKKKNRAGR